MEESISTTDQWPHCPPHWLVEGGSYMVTSGTYRKESHFNSPGLLSYLQKSLLATAEEYGWELQAWAVFPNHYHFVGRSASPASLPIFLKKLHSMTSRKVNSISGTAGRKVWFQYWDSQIRNERSWFARLAYVNGNAVKHGIVKRAEDYPYCSALWLRNKSLRSFIETLERIKTDRVSVIDDF